jgi:hypothetical protein
MCRNHVFKNKSDTVIAKYMTQKGIQNIIGNNTLYAY